MFLWFVRAPIQALSTNSVYYVKNYDNYLRLLYKSEKIACNKMGIFLSWILIQKILFKFHVTKWGYFYLEYRFKNIILNY